MFEKVDIFIRCPITSLPLKLYTTVEEGITNLEKKLFTFLVYARGLTGPVQV